MQCDLYNGRETMVGLFHVRCADSFIQLQPPDILLQAL